MDVIGERTEFVFGQSVQAGGSGSPAPPTAVGVYHGIRASLEQVFGSADLEAEPSSFRAPAESARRSPVVSQPPGRRSSSPTSIPPARGP